MSSQLLDTTEFRVSAFGAQLVVFGKAESGGSKKAFVNKRTGKAIVTDDNPKAKAWKQTVQVVAGTLMKGREPFAGPLRLQVTFWRERPKSHYGARGVVKSAPRFQIVKPDATKLLRPLEDALTGILWLDDAQIVSQQVEKKYADEDRTEIRVWVIP